MEAPCVNHAGNPAASVCERCGDFICQLCTTAVEGRADCPKCFDLLYRRGALQFAQREFSLPSMCLTMGILSLVLSFCGVLCFVSLPLAVAGLFMGGRALKEHAERPDLPNRGLTVTSMWMSGIAVVVNLVLIALIIFRLAQ